MAFPSGRPGDPAVPPVEKGSRRGVVCATTPLQLTGGSLARDRIQKCKTVTRSRVQWTGTGQNGVPGKNARGAVDAATEPGPELAIIHQLNTVGGRVKGLPWKSSCATFGLAQFMEHGVPGSLGGHAA